jgi:hypothetical protein
VIDIENEEGRLASFPEMRVEERGDRMAAETRSAARRIPGCG